METVMTALMIRFGLVVLGIAVLVLVAVAAVAIARRKLRTQESRQRASSMVRSASGVAARYGGGKGVGAVVRRAGDLAADHLTTTRGPDGG